MIASSFEIASAFVAALAGSPDVPLTWQTFDDVEQLVPQADGSRKWIKRKAPQLARTLHGPISGAWQTLAALNAQGAGVFYCVNTTDLKGRERSNVTALRAAFVDKDDGYLDAARILPTHPPTMRVESSAGVDEFGRPWGKEQALWLLAPGEALGDFEVVQRSLAARFGGDNVHDLPRVLRLPGTVHNKRTPRLVERIAYADLNRRFTIAELLAAYGTNVGPQRPLKANAFEPRPAFSDDFRGERGSGRSAFLMSYAGKLRAAGHEFEAILAGVRARNAHFVEPEDDSECVKVSTNVCKYEPSVDLTLNAALASIARPPEPPRAQSVAVTPPAPPPSIVAAPVASAQLSPQAWTLTMAADAKGTPKGCVGNVDIIMSNHPEWDGVLGFNARSLKMEWLRRPPWDPRHEPGSLHRSAEKLAPHLNAARRPVDDEDATRVATWLTERFKMSVGESVVYAAMKKIAKRILYDPVVEYLDALPAWDGVERLSTWLHDFGGAASTPYAQVVGKRFLIQLVARGYRPGCKADMTPIAEGPQGWRKSAFWREVVAGAGPDAFSDQLPAEFGSKDAKQHCHGPWLIEIPELSGFGRSLIEVIKAFLTTQVDKFRPPYGHVQESFPRGCCFAGTVNPDVNGYLRDSTGNRRFAPFACEHEIDIKGLIAARDQLFAEAKHFYDHPDREEIWWLTKAENGLAEYEQEERLESDAIEDKVHRALEFGVKRDVFAHGPGDGTEGVWLISPRPDSVSVAEIMVAVCEARGDLDLRLQQRVGRVLKKLKWTRRRLTGPGRAWRYFRPEGSNDAVPSLPPAFDARACLTDVQRAPSGEMCGRVPAGLEALVAGAGFDVDEGWAYWDE